MYAQRDQKITINFEWAGVFKKAFVAHPKIIFTVLGYRKTEENHESR
jgi:hypothetical protein